jgi:hypothetical protein
MLPPAPLVASYQFLQVRALFRWERALVVGGYVTTSLGSYPPEDAMGWHVVRLRGTRPDVTMGISGRLAQK